MGLQGVKPRFSIFLATPGDSSVYSPVSGWLLLLQETLDPPEHYFEQPVVSTRLYGIVSPQPDCWGLSSNSLILSKIPQYL